MKRCDFTPISMLAESSLSSSEFDLKTEHCYDYETPQTFFLPANVSLALHEILPMNSLQSNRVNNNQHHHHHQHSNNCQSRKFSSSSSSGSSCTSSSSTHAIPAKISVINYNEKTIEYGLCSQMQQSKFALTQSLQDLSAALYREGPSTSSVISQSWTDLIQSYSHAIADTNNVISNILAQTNELLSEATINSIQSNLFSVKSQIEASMKNYSYSVYILDAESTFKEAYKGVSSNLASVLAGTPQAFGERILRFGDLDLFSSASRASTAFTLMQQIVNMQYYEHFGFTDSKSTAVQRFDDKQVLCSAHSRIIPLSERVAGVHDRAIFYAFLRVTEVLIDENALILNSNEGSQTDLSTSSHSSDGNHSPVHNNANIIASNNNNTNQNAVLEAYEQHEEYLQSIQNFQEKYYGKGQMRKKRYRKTKAQVEEELKYYLALNMNQIKYN